MRRARTSCPLKRRTTRSWKPRTTSSICAPSRIRRTTPASRRNSAVPIVAESCGRSTTATLFDIAVAWGMPGVPKRCASARPSSWTPRCGWRSALSRNPSHSLEEWRTGRANAATTFSRRNSSATRGPRGNARASYATPSSSRPRRVVVCLRNPPRERLGERIRSIRDARLTRY